MNQVKVEPYKTKVTIEFVRIQSQNSFVSPYQLVDVPGERINENQTK